MGLISAKGEGAPNPMGALSRMGGKVSWSGVQEFIAGVRGFFGKAEEFSDRAGFKGGAAIQNALLQYVVVQAFQLEETNSAIKGIKGEVERMGKGSGESYAIWILGGILAILVLNTVITVRYTMGNNQNLSQNVNVNRVQ